MERRQFMNQAAGFAGGILIAGGLSAKAVAAETHAEKGASKWTITDQATLSKIAALRTSLQNCIKAGEACAQHCQEQLAKGETMFADCSAAVTQMLVVCEATAKLASMKSVRVKDLISACLNACQSCKDACDAHAAHWKHGMHLVCKECSEACGQVVSDLKKLA
jgi:Cys-rich four helix bundle protein (predicted Tat secretion target)